MSFLLFCGYRYYFLRIVAPLALLLQFVLVFMLKLERIVERFVMLRSSFSITRFLLNVIFLYRFGNAMIIV
jgi:hypothetical protein